MGPATSASVPATSNADALDRESFDEPAAGEPALPLPGVPGLPLPEVVVIEPDPRRRDALLAALGSGTVGVGTLDEARSCLGLAGVAADDARWRARTPVVVVTGPSLPAAAAVPLVASHPGAVVVAVRGRGSTAELRDALAAGVGDLLGAEAPAAQLRHAVRRAGVAAEVAVRTGICPSAGAGVARPALEGALLEDPVPLEPAVGGGLVAVLSPKGGTGGTTVAVNLALALADGAPPSPGDPPAVVVVDADLQFGDVALLGGVEPVRSMASLVRGSPEAPGPLPDATSVGRALVRIPDTAVSLLPAPVDPALAERLPAAVLGAVLDALVEMAAWVVVDLPSVIDDRTLEVLDRAGTVLLVASSDPLALKNARSMADLFERLGLAGRWAVVCNAPSPASGVGVGALEQHLGRRVVASIPHDPAVAAAVLRGRALLRETPTAPAARALVALAGSLRTPPVDDLLPSATLRNVVDRLVVGPWRNRLAGR